MAQPPTFGLLPHVHPRAFVGGKVDPRYTAHLTDFAPWPDAMTKPGAAEVGFGPVVGDFYNLGAQGAFNGTGAKSAGVGINPALADAMAARWSVPGAPEAEFQAALYGSDPVELDLVFMRAHAMGRWDLLPGWYAKTWFERGSVRSFAPPTSKPAAPFVAGPAGIWGAGVGSAKVWIVTGYKPSGEPIFATVEKTWKPTDGVAAADFGPWPAWASDPKKTPIWVLTPPARDVARGDGFDTLPTSSSSDAHGSTWSWWWANGQKIDQTYTGYGEKATAGSHNWPVIWKQQWTGGLNWKPLSAWTGPHAPSLAGLALDADALRQSDEWQEKAKTWWESYAYWCKPFGYYQTAGHLPPLWQAPAVTYRPHWWIVDSAFLKARLDVTAPEIFANGAWYQDQDWHAETFRAAIEEWVATDHHIVDPYGWWGHIACENKADQDFGDFLEVVFPIVFVSVFAPAMAGALVGAFGVAGTTLGSALGEILGAGIGGGLNAEAGGGTFGDGFGDIFEDPLELAVDLAGGVVEDLAGLAEGTIEEVVDQIEAAIEDPLSLLDGFGGDFLEDALGLGEGTLEAAGDLLAGEVPEIPMGWFDDILPDSFEEGLDFVEDALDIYDTFEDVFGGDDGFGGTAGGIAGGAGDLLDLLGGGIGGGGGGIGAGGGGGGAGPLPSDVGLGLAPKTSSTLSDLAPVFAIGLLALVVVRS